MTDLTDQQRGALEIADRWAQWIADVSADMDPDDGAKAKFRRDCEYLRTYILNSTAVPEWQPIETAPSETLVLLRSGIRPSTQPVVGMVNHYEDADGNKESLAKVLHYNGQVLVRAFHATHWMLLPATPHQEDHHE